MIEYDFNNPCFDGIDKKTHYREEDETIRRAVAIN